jgi:hypothetical protein
MFSGMANRTMRRFFSNLLRDSDMRNRTFYPLATEALMLLAPLVSANASTIALQSTKSSESAFTLHGGSDNSLTVRVESVAPRLDMDGPVSCTAQNVNDVEPRRWEVTAKPYLILAPMGLLGDLTNLTPGLSLKSGIAYVCNSDIALRLTIGTSTWFGSHQIRSTDNHRAKVNKGHGTLGLIYLFGNTHRLPLPDEFTGFRYYFSVDAGVAQWIIDSSTHATLNGSKYYKPTAAICVGMKELDFFFEAGLEINFLETNKIEFKKYNSPNVALVCGFGYSFSWSGIQRRR